MTYPTEKQIEASAVTIYNPSPFWRMADMDKVSWSDLDENFKNDYRRMAKAAIIASDDAAWETIDKAPEIEDAQVMVFCPFYDKDFPELICTARYHHDAGYCVCMFRTPTHFRPLPLGPKEGE